MLVRLTILMLLLGGCPAADDDDSSAAPDDDDDGTPFEDDDDSARSACEPPLAIAPAEVRILPLGLFTPTASGGEGDYRWELADNQSGGILNDRTGAYLAGQTVDVTDVLRLTDLGCVGEATAQVHTIGPIEVLPGDLVIPPQTAFRWAVSGGSGSYLCSLEASSASSTMTDDCDYVAGSNEGSDIVRVEDTVSGDFVLRSVVVDPSTSLTGDAPRIAMPLGSSYQLRFTGGSGVVDLVGDAAGVVEWDGDRAHGLAPGSVVLDAVDAFTGQSVPLRLDVLAPLYEDPLPWAGNVEGGRVHSRLDLDGDGFRDVVLSLGKAALDGASSGGTFVYAGTATGLNPTPVQVFSGGARDDEMGLDSDLADVDGDGAVDLVVGVHRSDLAGGGSGSVRVYRGVAGGFFEDEPAQTLLGSRGGIRSGRGIAACDFNGDGRADLAIGANEDEDQTAVQTANNQGSIRIHLTLEDGTSELLPSQTLWGSFPGEDGVWVASPEHRMGRDLVAADFDGDGNCDLVSASFGYDGALFNDQGAVVIFQGTDTGVNPQPWLGLAQVDPLEPHNGEVGRSLSTGDVDGDGLADLLLGAPRQTALWEDAGSRRGFAHLFTGAQLSAASFGALLDVNEASWQHYGDSNNDRTGYAVTLADVDGDGLDDAVVAAVEDELEDLPNNTGTASIFLSDGTLPATEPAARAVGASEGDWFGALIGTIADGDGDGLDDLFVHALRDNTIGVEVGQPWRAPSAGGDLEALGFPVVAAARDFGVHMTMLTGDDGEARLAVGESRAARLPETYTAGRATLYELDGDAFSPMATLSGFEGHDANDRFGRSFAVGDFDGDGFDDLAVVAEDDDRPGSFDPATVANPDACPGFQDRVGSVRVFRGLPGGAIAGTPAFVWYGPDVQQRVLSAAGGFDANGDGYDDLVVGGPGWDLGAGNDGGGVALLYGRDAAPGGATVICAPDWQYTGLSGGDNLGYSVAAAGDLDGDGCDEFAAGATGEDLGRNNQGTVRLVFGWGPGCGWAGAHAVVLGANQNNANLGRSLSGGVDVDADGLPDLAVAADNYTVAGSQVGRVTVLPGQWLSSLAPEPLIPGAEPSIVYTAQPDEGTWRLDGRVDEEDFGNSITLVEALDGPWGGVVVGSPGAANSGDLNTGGGHVHVYDPSLPGGGMNPLALLVLGGESWNAGSRLGSSTAAGVAGGRVWAAWGGIFVDGGEADGGGVYVIDLGP